MFSQDSGIENSHFHDDNLLHSVINLFAAGNDTTANTLKWCLLYMAKYPHIQGSKHKLPSGDIKLL